MRPKKWCNNPCNTVCTILIQSYNYITILLQNRFYSHKVYTWMSFLKFSSLLKLQQTNLTNRNMHFFSKVKKKPEVEDQSRPKHSLEEQDNQSTNAFQLNWFICNIYPFYPIDKLCTCRIYIYKISTISYLYPSLMSLKKIAGFDDLTPSKKS